MRADEAFLQLLKAQTGPSMAGPDPPKNKTHPGHAQLAKLRLQESDVAKVCFSLSVLLQQPLFGTDPPPRVAEPKSGYNIPSYRAHVSTAVHVANHSNHDRTSSDQITLQ